MLSVAALARSIVAARESGVDRNLTESTVSRLSARSPLVRAAWIEIKVDITTNEELPVAARKSGVDRNITERDMASKIASPLARAAWVEISYSCSPACLRPGRRSQERCG